MTAIGDTVYEFDINRRVYRKDASGRSIGGPIYREHFRPWVIVGEATKQSWLVSSDGESKFTVKMTKRSLRTAQEVGDLCWREEHRHRLCDAIRQCEDVDTLKAIAALVGYTEA